MKQVYTLLSSLLACFVALAFLLSSNACNQDARDALPTIEGHWATLVPSGPPQWQYELRNGLLTQWAEGYGATLSYNTYPYAERGDTLIIGGDETNAPRRWLVRLIGTGAAEVLVIPSANPGIGGRLILERKN